MTDDKPSDVPVMSYVDTETVRTKQRRGFAAMSPEKQREIASMGGKTAQSKGTAHRWTAETATVAGRKGGQANALRRRKVESDV